jgi:hypothetical protein
MRSCLAEHQLVNSRQVNGGAGQAKKAGGRGSITSDPPKSIAISVPVRFVAS